MTAGRYDDDAAIGAQRSLGGTMTPESIHIERPSLMSGHPIELNGIALEIPNPRRYLRVLSRAMELVPFYSPALRQAVAEALGDSGPPDSRVGRDAIIRVLGFVDYELIAVIDREWQDYPDNEADRLFQYASSRGLFASVRSAFVWGAGPCRLADHLASLEFIDQVICSDLSWSALNFGRALIEGNYEALPEPLVRARTFYHVNPASPELFRTTRQSRFKPPMTPPGRGQCIRYTVRDAFAATGDPIAADLIVVPYLLDAFRGAQCISLLLRICQRIRAGQQIVILMTCIAEGRAGPGRDPGLVMDVLQKCGFKTQFLDLVFLPYSFSYHSYAQMRTDWNTLVVRAERSAERGADMVIAGSERWTAFQAGQANKTNPLGSANLDLVMGRLSRPQPYQAMANALIPSMGAEAFENAIGELASRGLIDLSVELS